MSSAKIRTRSAACALLTAALAAAVASAQPAAAAPTPAPLPNAATSSGYAGCWKGPWHPPEPSLRTWIYWCHNYRGGYVVRGASTRVGYLYAGTNWFACQKRGSENPPVGSARNNWWLWTTADVAYSNRGVGWFPATHVSGGCNYQPIPGIGTCN